LGSRYGDVGMIPISPYQVSIKELHDYCVENNRWCEFSKGGLHKWIKGVWV